MLLVVPLDNSQCYIFVKPLDDGERVSRRELEYHKVAWSSKQLTENPVSHSVFMGCIRRNTEQHWLVPLQCTLGYCVRVNLLVRPQYYNSKTSVSLVQLLQYSILYSNGAVWNALQRTSRFHPSPKGFWVTARTIEYLTITKLHRILVLAVCNPPFSAASFHFTSLDSITQ